MKPRRPLPLETLSRLPVYREQLLALLAENTEVISSRGLAMRLGISDAQLRRDLSYLGLLGRPGLGYRVRGVLEKITEVLGLDREWRLAIVGYGALGTALARYEGFARNNMAIVAIFDVDPKKIGKEVRGIRVSPLSEATNIVPTQQVDIAIITVPAAQAQGAVDEMVDAGVRALLNFAPVAVCVPEGVIVRTVDISSELQILTYLIVNRGTR